MAMRVNVGGKSFLVDDLTLAELVKVDEETGGTWAGLRPLASPAVAASVLVRFLARETGEDKAREQVDAMSATQVVAAFKPSETDERPDEWQNGSPVVDPTEAGGDPATT